MDGMSSMIQRRRFVSQLVSGTAATGFVLSLAGCGTLLHKERVNRPHSGDLDWSMVALNGLGLILFFIPGVIAFVVDFHTGAIYLPSGPMAMKPPLAGMDELAGEPVSAADSGLASSGNDRVVMKKIAVSTDELNLSTIKRAVSEQLGSPILLDESTSRVTELENLEQFEVVRRLHEEDQSFGLSPKRFLERLQAARFTLPFSTR